MAGKHRANGCDGKTKHTSKKAARTALNKLTSNATHRATLQVYKCDACGSYHVGHWTTPPRP